MRRAAVAALSGLLALLRAGSPLFAQTGVVTDAGFAVVRFPDDRTTAGGPWLRAAVGRDSLDVLQLASASLFVTEAGWSGSADAAGWWRATLGGGWAGEAGSELSALFGSTVRPTENALAGARLFRELSPAGGVWLRGVGQGARREAGVLAGASVDVGGWLRAPFGVITASVLRESTQGQLFADDSRDHVLGTVPVRYVEGTASLSGDVEAASFELVAGARRDPDAAERLEAMLSASLQLWLSRSQAVTVTLARQPADFVHGADASRSVSVGLRFGERPRLPTPRRGARPAGPTLAIGDATGATRRIVVHAPGGSSIELMADFTGWEPVALARAGDDFVIELSIPPGTHRVAVRVNGGTWIPPANTPAVDDDFGGRVGLVTVM